MARYFDNKAKVTHTVYTCIKNPTFFVYHVSPAPLAVERLPSYAIALVSPALSFSSRALKESSFIRVFFSFAFGLAFFYFTYFYPNYSYISQLPCKRNF